MIKTIKRWLFRKREHDAEAAALDDLCRAELDLIEDGWMSWFLPAGPRPWNYPVIEIRRRDGPVVVTAYEAIPKEMNGNGLYWRPWDGVTLETAEETAETRDTVTL
jgi:hypothetical protein